MTNLEQLINNIQTLSANHVKIDKSFFADTDIKYNPSYRIPEENQYIYNELGIFLDYFLNSERHIQTCGSEKIIQIPKIIGPDFVINIKEIYDTCNKSKPLLELGKEIYNAITSGIDTKNKLLKYISHIELKGIYINIYTSDAYKNAVLNQISQLGKNYGNIYIPEFTGKNIIAEFPSCNTAKAMGVHHVRAMVIGQVWNNIISKTGANICKWNYLGDRGTPFGKLVYSIEYHGRDASIMRPSDNSSDIYTQIESHPNEILGNIYANFKSIESDDKEDIARSYFARLENGDTNMIALRKYIRNLSLVDFQNIFDKFGVKPDCSIGESYAQLFEKDVVNDLTQANLLHESNGALVVKFIRQDGELEPLQIGEQEPENKDSMEIFIIKKSDGSTNYATRDLGLMKIRGQNKADKIYICTDNGQSLHFVLINILAVRLGYISKNTFVHIPFGLLLSNGEKMSTRGGKLFRLQDMISEIEDKVKSDFAEKGVSDAEAEKLAVAAIIFNDIKGDINKDIHFDIKAITNLGGDSGIYLKGTMNRLKGLIDTFKYKYIDTQTPQEFHKFSVNNNTLKNIYIDDDRISDIIVKLSYISKVYSDSIALVKPHILVQYILSLCADINSWYNNGEKLGQINDEDKLQGYVYILKMIYIGLANLFDTIQIKSE